MYWALSILVSRNVHEIVLVVLVLGRVGLLGVDDEEVHSVGEALLELLHSEPPVAKDRAGMAAQLQDRRSTADPLSERYVAAR